MGDDYLPAYLRRSARLTDTQPLRDPPSFREMYRDQLRRADIHAAVSRIIERGPTPGLREWLAANERLSLRQANEPR